MTHDEFVSFFLPWIVLNQLAPSRPWVHYAMLCGVYVLSLLWLRV